MTVDGMDIVERAQKFIRVGAEGRLLDGTPCEDCGHRAAWLCKYRVDHDGNTCERAVCAEHSRVRGWLGREVWSCLVHDPPKEQLAMELTGIFDHEDPTTWGWVSPPRRRDEAAG